MTDTIAVQIKGDDSDILSVTLNDILQCVKEGSSFNWSILWLEAIGDLGEKSILDFEAEIKRAKDGLFIEWDKLLELSTKFYQVIEIILIGDRDASKLRRYNSDNEMYSTCEYTFELVDSSYWLIHSQDAKTISCMKSSLPGTKNIGAPEI